MVANIILYNIVNIVNLKILATLSFFNRKKSMFLFFNIYIIIMISVLTTYIIQTLLKHNMPRNV